jgi:hypothetical protein
MIVEIGTEAMEFPEKEYINGIFFAVRHIAKSTLPLIYSCLISALLAIIRFFKENGDIKVLSLRIRAEFHNIIYILYICTRHEG